MLQINNMHRVEGDNQCGNGLLGNVTIICMHCQLATAYVIAAVGASMHAGTHNTVKCSACMSPLYVQLSKQFGKVANQI